MFVILKKQFVLKGEIEKEMVYHCDVCNKLFTKRRNLSKHVNETHMKQNVWICTMKDCDKTFSRRSNLHVHLQNIHKLSSAKARDDCIRAKRQGRKAECSAVYSDISQDEMQTNQYSDISDDDSILDMIAEASDLLQCPTETGANYLDQFIDPSGDDLDYIDDVVIEPEEIGADNDGEADNEDVGNQSTDSDESVRSAKTVSSDEESDYIILSDDSTNSGEDCRIVNKLDRTIHTKTEVFLNTYKDN